MYFREIYDALPNVAEQVITDVKEAQRKYELKELSDIEETLLRQQILQIGNSEHKIRTLVRKLCVLLEKQNILYSYFRSKN